MVKNGVNISAALTEVPWPASLAVFVASVHVVPCKSELLPDVHTFIDHHFQDLPFGVESNFCTQQDALNSFRFSKLSKFMGRRVMTSMNVDQEESWVFANRLSVFLDCSCPEGLAFLRKHSKKMDLNYSWLIFVDSMIPVMDILNVSRLEFDSDVTLIVQSDGVLQVWQPSRIHFKQPLTLSNHYSEVHSPYASWDEREGFRNYTFEGGVLFLESQHGHLQDWDLLLNKSVEPGVETIRRYFAHPVIYFMDMYSFSLNVFLSKDWGVVQANGSFNGLLGQVERREIDFGFSAIRIIPARLKSVDFSFPIIDSRFHWVLIQPKTFGTPAALVVPFTYGAWVAFIVLVIVLIAFVRLTTLVDKSQYQNDSWGGSMLLVFSSVSQNGIDETATKFNTKITYFVVSTATFMLFLYYCTSVLNGLILPTPDAIQNIQDLLEADIKLGSHDISYLHEEFKKNDTMTQRATQKKPPLEYLPLEEGWERVKKGHFAFYGLDTSLRTAMAELLSPDEMCLITEIQMIRGFGLSYFWIKKSPFADIFNRGLIKMAERGILPYLREYWLVQLPKCQISLDFFPIKLQGMALAYGIFFIGVSMSLLIVLLELLVARRRRSTTVRPFSV